MIFGAAAAFVFWATVVCIQFLRLKLLESVLCLIRFRGIPDLLCVIVVRFEVDVDCAPFQNTSSRMSSGELLGQQENVQHTAFH
ncbi:hypothetical protein HPP92_016258 [Vanilla planifolia]|uniref:Uncharacterized protein n=1 Tax=Vanilla planifolia TaxID=51239 RepID=A0A835URW4_VANPL|nr:hypothetical protein HPP92_016258 [Vanilla planifolia]